MQAMAGQDSMFAKTGFYAGQIISSTCLMRNVHYWFGIVTKITLQLVDLKPIFQ
jgi:hypothetical protein